MLRRTNLILLIGLLACMDIHNVAAFLKPRIVPAHGNPTTLFSTEVSEDFVTTANTPTTDWELDCYSRPVLVDGKKLWEVLITDSSNSFRYSKILPSNAVNSRELRKVVEDVIEKADVKPNTIRFFRGAMFNMVRAKLIVLPFVKLDKLHYLFTFL